MTDATETPKSRRKSPTKAKRTRVPSDIAKMTVAQLAVKRDVAAKALAAIDAEFVRRNEELSKFMPMPKMPPAPDPEPFKSPMLHFPPGVRAMGVNAQAGGEAHQT